MHLHALAAFAKSAGIDEKTNNLFIHILGLFSSNLACRFTYLGASLQQIWFNSDRIRHLSYIGMKITFCLPANIPQCDRGWFLELYNTLPFFVLMKSCFIFENFISHVKFFSCGFLSNWWVCPVKHGGFLLACKQRLFAEMPIIETNNGVLNM